MCISRQNLNGNLFVIDYTITTQMNQSSKNNYYCQLFLFQVKIKTLLRNYELVLNDIFWQNALQIKKCGRNHQM